MSWQTIVQTIFGQRYYEVHNYPPRTLTVTTTPQPLTVQLNTWCLGYQLRVRTMGSCTYVAIGDRYNREFRLTVPGETFGWSANPREVMNLNDVWVHADANDAVIEIYSLYKEGTEGEDFAVDT